MVGGNKLDFKGNLKRKDIISIYDLSKEEIIHILDTAARIEAMGKDEKKKLLRDYIMAFLFYEPSTRTRLSFQSAMTRLGGKVVGFSDPKMSSSSKGESVFDTIKMMENYSDIIVIRNPLEGSARLAAESTEKPVINAGDGANQHPTQTLLDLHTIRKTQGKLEGLNIAMVGDLKYGRTVHSLSVALSLFGCRLYFVAPKALKMPKHYLKELDKKGIKYSEHEKIEEVIKEADILYMTRIQEERFPDPTEYEKLKGVYVLRKAMLDRVRKNMKIMHPLPRVNEIHTDVDDTPYAEYFQQAANGVPTRQAVICLLLGVLK